MDILGQTPARQTRQPQYSARLDRAHPALQGASLVVSYAASGVNQVTMRPGDLQVGARAPGIGQYGRYDSAYSGLGSGVGAADDRFSLPSLTDFALLAVVDYSSSPGVANSVIGSDGSGNRAFQFRFNTSNQLEFIRFDTGGNPYFATIAAPTRKGVILGVSIGNTFKVYFGGASSSSTISNTPQAVTRCSIGDGFGFDTTPDVGAKIFMAAVLRGSAADKVAQQLLANPWQLWLAPDGYIAMDALAGGVSGSLAYTNINDSVSASGVVGSAVAGSSSTVNADDAAAASGGTTIVGALSRANASDTVAASGGTTVTGALAVTNANDLATASGAAGSVSGTVNYTNRNDACSANGSTPNVQESGGFFEIPQVLRHRSVKEDRERLGIIPREVKQIVKAVARATVAAEKTDTQAQAQLLSRLEQQDIEAKAKYAEFMRQERDRLRTQAIARAVQIQRRKQQLDDEEDDRDAVILLMS